jgi:nitrite reductase (NADH) large subunit
VIATGITPNAELGFEAGLAGRRGIEVNDYLGTSDPDISAIGECSEHNGQTFGLVEPIWQHCISLADRLASNVHTAYENTPVATKLKVSGVQVFSAGEWLTTDEHREVVFSDVARNTYRKLLLKNDRIVGIVFFGDVRDGQYFFELMEHGVVVTQALPQLLMGRAFCSEVPQIAAESETVAA